MPASLSFTRVMLRLARCLFASVLAAFSLAASAASVYIEELTWTELRDQIQAGTTTIIVPIGGTEQNGPAMVLGKHNVRARVLAGRIATGLGHAVVAPTIAYVPEGAISPPVGHMRFTGTISIPDAAFETTLEYAARSFRQHGFKDIVFIGDHGGYQKNMVRVAAKLDKEWAATPVRVHALQEYYQVLDTDYKQALKRKGMKDAEIGTHAGALDTSLALAVDPQLVRADRLHSASLGAAEGVYGDPRPSTAEAGQLGVDLIVGRSIEAIKRHLARH